MRIGRTHSPILLLIPPFLLRSDMSPSLLLLNLSPPVVEIHMDQLSAIVVNSFDPSSFTLASPSRSWVLRMEKKDAEGEKTVKEWVEKLEVSLLADHVSFLSFLTI